MTVCNNLFRRPSVSFCCARFISELQSRSGNIASIMSARQFHANFLKVKNIALVFCWNWNLSVLSSLFVPQLGSTGSRLFSQAPSLWRETSGGSFLLKLDQAYGTHTHTHTHRYLLRTHAAHHIHLRETRRELKKMHYAEYYASAQYFGRRAGICDGNIQPSFLIFPGY